jgi:hypothetical protein
MRFQSALIAAFALCLTTAVAAPPGTPSGPAAVRPLFNAACASGFSANPSSFEPNTINPSYQCSQHWNSDGCNTSAGMSVYKQNEPYGSWTWTGGHQPSFTYYCISSGKFLPPPHSWTPNCGSMTNFTAGPYDANTHMNWCHGPIMTCSSGLEVSVTSAPFPIVEAGNFKYTCMRPK